MNNADDPVLPLFPYPFDRRISLRCTGLNRFGVRLMNKPVGQAGISSSERSLRGLPALRTLMTLPCADHGVGMTCRSILRGAVQHGVKADLFTSRSDSSTKEPFPLFQFTPSALQELPFSFSRPLSVRTLHKAYLKACPLYTSSCV